MGNTLHVVGNYKAGGTHIGNVLKTGGTSSDLNQPEAIMRRFGLSEK